MKIRIIVAATSAALFSLGALAAGDDKQKQSQGQEQQGAQQSQSSQGSSGSASAGASASGQSQSQAQGGAQSSDIVKQVQQKLSQEGHQLQADGVMGPKTQAALKDYQQKKGLDASGNLDKQTLSALGVSGEMGGASAATGGSGQEKEKSEKKQ